MNFEIYLWSSPKAMADSRKREKDRNTKYWISQDQKELFRWNKNDFIGRLDSSVSSDEKDIAIEGYNIVCADHPSNDKEGGLCIYYEESFAVQFININFLNRCVLCEVTFDNKKATVQSYIDLLIKVALNLITFFQVLKICLMSLVLLVLTFQLSLVTLMQDQNLGGKII